MKSSFLETCGQDEARSWSKACAKGLLRHRICNYTIDVDFAVRISQLRGETRWVDVSVLSAGINTMSYYAAWSKRLAFPLWFAFLIHCHLANGLHADESVQEIEKEEAVRLDRVLLFPAGQGVFEFELTQPGEHRLQLLLTDHERDDLLKTLVCSQIDTVHVSYGAEDLQDIPALKRLETDPTTTLAELIQGLRGQRLSISSDGQTTKGTLIGVEAGSRWHPNGEEQVELACLNTSEGLVRVVLEESSVVAFESEGLQSRFERILQRRQGKSVDRLPVTIHVGKKREEPGRIVFALETAPWKCAYRLIATDQENQLQASAIVDNMSGIDWKDVEVVLVVDQLLGFHSPLSRIADWGRDSMPIPTPFSASPPVLIPGNRRSNLSLIVNAPQASGGFGMGGMGGGMGGMGGSMGGSFESDPFGPNPSAFVREDAERDQRLGISFSADDLSRTSFGKRVQISLPQVTLPSGESHTFFLPKVPQKVDDVRVFVEGIHNRHPLSAFDVTLQEGYQLPGGPGAVWRNGGYAGDVMIPRLVSGVPQLLTYALDSMIEIQHDEPTADAHVVVPSTWALVEHGLMETATWERIHRYRIRNEGLRSLILFVEHSQSDDDWEPLRNDASEPTQDNASHRYRLRLPPSNSTEFEVKEKKTQGIIWNHRSDLARLRAKLKDPQVQGFARLELEKFVTTIQQEASFAREMEKLNQELAQLTQDQNRIKGLLSALARGDDLHSRYIDKLNHLEDEIERIRHAVEELKRSRSAEPSSR
jgi:hypothetical protein